MLEELKKEYNQQLGAKSQLLAQYESKQLLYKKLKRRSKVVEKARVIVHEVALETQKQLEFRISDLVSRALDVIFDDGAYELVLQFEEKRGKTECLLQFKRDGELFDPLTSSGYGAVDIAAFALRVACRGLARNNPPIFILDEPFKHLKGQEPNKMAIELLKEISDELGIQIITVSDERADKDDIVSSADCVYEVTKSGHCATITKL